MLHKLFMFIGIFSLFFTIIKAEGTETRALPEPQKSGGMPLMEALSKRQSQRSFRADDISKQQLSNLLWAAFGINRPKSGKRTAPSAMNMQEIDIYVCSKEGVFLYDAQKHALEKIKTKDIRNLTGNQGFVDESPLNLVFVADYSAMGSRSMESKKTYSWCDTGYISQNVYLYCASQRLASVVRASISRDKLHSEMGLDDDQKIVLAQTIGYPK